MSGRLQWLGAELPESAKCAKGVVLPADYMSTTSSSPLASVDILGPNFKKDLDRGIAVRMLALAGVAGLVWYLVTR